MVASNEHILIELNFDWEPKSINPRSSSKEARSSHQDTTLCTEAPV